MAAACLTEVSAAVLVHDFYLPMPEAQVRQTFSALTSRVGSTLDSVFSVVATGEGTLIHYDQWEDGYEINLANPLQSSTQIWGDGNNGNGIAPGFANDPVGLPAGTVLSLRNLVPLPRNPSVLLFDGRDRMAATKALVVSHAAWATSPGPVLAGAVEVSATIDHGTSYISPVGEDANVPYFRYVGLMVMATEDNTSVTIDPDGSGAVSPFVKVLGRGESHLVNGGVKVGGTVDSTKPVQVQLVIGNTGGRYATDWFTLVPVEQWGDSYYTPVGTSADGNPTINYFYNPGPGDIIINYTTRAGSGSFSVPNGAVTPFQMPQSSGARFTSVSNAPFFAVAKAGARKNGENAYDWGFTLLPTEGLTSEAVVGWGPGSSDGSVNGSPVWVTAVSATRLYIDFNGDRSGPLTDPNGDRYDVDYDVGQLESLLVYDPDGDQTAMRLYTVDGTSITAAWGEDPAVARPGNPYFDFGTTVLPFPTPTIRKTSAIFQDNGAPGLGIGDVIEYTVDVDNRGLLPLGNTVVLDELPTNLISYVADSTLLNGNPIPDNTTGSAFPLDETGYTIPVILRGGSSRFSFQVTTIAPGAITNIVEAAGYSLSAGSVTLPPPGGTTTQCTMDFTDSGGTHVGFYAAGSGVYLSLDDLDANFDSAAIESVSVTVQNANTGDSETITLIETSASSGSFRNTTALPTSVTTGLLEQDGTLSIAPGDTLSAAYTDALFGDLCTAGVIIQVPSLNKMLYLSDTGNLDRIDPVAEGDASTAQTAILIPPYTASFVTDPASTGSAVAPQSTLSVNHTTGSEANRLMLVTVAYEDDNNSGTVLIEATSVTYGGQALTRVRRQLSAQEAAIELWQLVNPPSVAGTVQVNLSGVGNAANDDSFFVGVASFSGVDPSAPFSATNSTIGTSTSASVTIPSAADELVFATMGLDDGRTATSAGGQTELWNGNTETTSDGVRSVASTKPGAASVTQTWTVGLDAWATIAVSLRPAPSVAGGTTDFTQTPAFSKPFSMPAGSVVSITNYLNVTSGSMPAAPDVAATLTHGATTILDLTSGSYNSGTGTIVWNGVLAGNVSIPSADALELTVQNNEPGVSFRVEYDSTAKPSQIALPTTTVIGIDSLSVYDAPYPNGSVVASAAAGAQLYVRTAVSDPFGAYDITGLDLTIDGPSTSNDVVAALDDADVVITGSSSKLYEYAWQTGTVPGSFSLSAVAHEGTEGITATAAAGISLIFQDLGTPGSIALTDGDNGSVINSFPADGTIFLRVIDADENRDSGVVETLTVQIQSGSDLETITLTETGPDTGVFTGSIVSSTLGGATGDGTLNAAQGSVIKATYADPDDADDQASVTGTILPPPGVPGLTVDMSLVSPTNGSAALGDVVRYAVRVINTGSTVLTGISLDDTYPVANLDYIASTLTPDSVTNGVLSWLNLGDLTPGQSLVMEIDFTAIGLSASVTNSASASDTGGASDGSFIPLSITQSSLDIDVSLLSPASGPVGIGGNVIFRVVVENTGNTAVPVLPLENQFSAAQFAFVSATVAPDGTGAGSLLWNDITGAGELDPGETFTVDITLQVAGEGNPAENTALVEFAEDEFGRMVPVASGTAGVQTLAASLTGHVYNDIDASGTLTAGDTGLADVVLQLFSDPNGDGDPVDGVEVRLVKTDATGSYELPNLALGDYVIVKTALPGFAGGVPANGRIAVNISSLAPIPNLDFFDVPASPANYAFIGGTVWLDADGNGALEGGEAGLLNVAVALVQDANGNGFADTGEPTLASDLTDASGGYEFSTVVSGSYVVVQTDLFGHTSTFDSVPPNDNQIGLTVTNTQVSTGNDFLDFFTGNTPGNDTPVTVADNYLYDPDTTLVVSAPGLLANDSDIDGDALFAALISSPAQGSLSLSTNGGFSYTPPGAFEGDATFSYAATDGSLTGTPVTVTLRASTQALLVSPATLNYTVQYGVGNPAPASVSIANNGWLTGTLPNVQTYSPGASGWFTLTPATLLLDTLTTTNLTGAASVSGLDAGTYTVTNSFVPPTAASAAKVLIATLTIEPIPVTVTLGDLSQVFDGTPKSVSVTTAPSVGSVEVTYDGSTTPPSAPGSYTVIAMVTTPNYAGAATNTLVIANGTPVISFPNPGPQVATAPIELSASSSNLQPVDFTVIGGPATLSGASNLVFTGIGTVTVVATQDANGGWNAAVPVTNTFSVSGSEMLVLNDLGAVISNQAPASVTLGTDFASIETNTTVFVDLSITNTGNLLLQLPTNTWSGAGAAYFAVSNFPTSVAAGTSATFRVYFNPSVIGLQDATLWVSNNALSGRYEIPFAGTGAERGAISIDQSLVIFNGEFGGVDPAAQVVVISNSGGLPIDVSNSGSASWLTINPVLTTNLSAGAAVSNSISVSLTGLDAGVYTVTNLVSSPTAINSPVEMIIELRIAKTGQTLTFDPIGDQVTTNVVSLSAAATSGETPEFDVLSGPAVYDPSGPSLSFTGTGTVSVVAFETNSVNYNAVYVTNTFNVAQTVAGITVGDLTPEYDGSPKPVAVTTQPSGLPTTITYGGSPNAPTNAGSYEVIITIDTPLFKGAVTNTLIIGKADQTIDFTNPGPQSVSDTVNLSATADSGLTVVFSVASGPGVLSGSTLTFTNSGTVVINADQSGDANWNASATTNVSFSVTAPNNAPTAVPDVATTFEDTPVEIDVLSNDSDADGDALSLVGAFSADGTAAVSGTNVVYTPSSGFFGNAVVSYLVSDGMDTSTGLVAVAVTQSADLSMTLTGPTNGVVDLPMTFVLTVANAGPSAASNVVVQTILPTNHVFMVDADGGTLTNNIVVWPEITALASGAVSSFTVTLTATNSGIYTNLSAASSSTFDPDPTNNDTSSGLSKLVLEIFVAEYGILEGPIVLNPQTGLFEQRVSVTNTMVVAVPGFRIQVDGLRAGVTMNNASGTTNGIPYVQLNTAMNPGDVFDVVLEYYVPDRLPFTNSLSVVWTLADGTPVVPGTGTVIDTFFIAMQDTNSPRFVIEFKTVPGQVYTILYSDDLMTGWRAAVPPVVASSTRTQWYDDGPPKTQTHPRDTTNRYYQVIQSD